MILLWICPWLLRDDLELIERVGWASSRAEVEKEVWKYQRHMRREEESLRVRWRLRVSGERLLRMAAELLPE